MLACVDVFYRDDCATAACILFRSWTDSAPCASARVTISPVAPYTPGQFFRRELPCILAVLDQVSEPVDLVVIDGYVWLDGRDTPGLGAHLYRALSSKTPVVGIAKNPYTGASQATPVLRGRSRRPLFVTAVGIDQRVAADHVAEMHGASRIPTLLKLADRLSKGRGGSQA